MKCTFCENAEANDDGLCTECREDLENEAALQEYYEEEAIKDQEIEYGD